MRQHDANIIMMTVFEGNKINRNVNYFIGSFPAPKSLPDEDFIEEYVISSSWTSLHNSYFPLNIYAPI